MKNAPTIDATQLRAVLELMREYGVTYLRSGGLQIELTASSAMGMVQTAEQGEEPTQTPAQPEMDELFAQFAHTGMRPIDVRTGEPIDSRSRTAQEEAT